MARATEHAQACDLAVGEVIHYGGERFQLVSQLARKPLDDPFAVAFATQHLGVVDDNGMPSQIPVTWRTDFVFRGDHNTPVTRECAAQLPGPPHEAQGIAWCILAGVLGLATNLGFVVDYVDPAHGDGAGAVAHVGEGLQKGAGFLSHEVDLTVLLTRTGDVWTFFTLDADGQETSIELAPPTSLSFAIFETLIEAVRDALPEEADTL